ncbi:tetratricopeptide repeat family protein [Calothrix sp. 336/3]|nr:tetratricopeptide repeat family protein [Calothrix sp. 336/3]
MSQWAKSGVRSSLLAFMVLGLMINIPKPVTGQTQQPLSTQQLAELAEVERLYKQGIPLYQQGRYSEAIPLAKKALAIREKVLGREHPDVAATLNHVAELYRLMGNYDQAEPLYVRSLTIREKVFGREHPDVATTLNNLGLLYQAQGNYSKARPLFVRSLEIYEKAFGREHSHVATSLNNLALLYESQGNYSEAESLYLKSLAILEKVLGREHVHVAFSLNNLAVLYQLQGDYSKAESLHLRSLGIREKVFGSEHPDVALSMNNLAQIYQIQGNYSKAESFQLRSLKIYEKLLGKEHRDVALSLNNLAGLYWQTGDINRTTDFLTRGLTVQEKNLQLIMYAVGSEQSKQKYAHIFMGGIDFTVTLALQKPNQNPTLSKLALTTILRRKGRVMDAMADTIQTLQSQLANNSETKKIFDEWLSTQQQLANLVYRGVGEQKFEIYQQQIKELETKKEELENKISRKSANFRQEIKPVELADIQTKIPTDAAMVEIIQYYPLNPKAKKESEKWGQPRYAAVALRSTGEPKWVDLGDAAAIDKSVTSFRQLLATSPGNNRGIDVTPNPEAQKSQISKLQELARNLDKQVMQPIRPLLGNARHILLSPDGQLNLIPFEALMDEQNKYLVENYAFSYLTTGRDLLRLDNTPKQLNNPVIFAGIDYEKQENLTATETKNRGNKRSINFANLTYGFLKGTLEEAQAIQKIIPNAQLLTGKKATETAIKQLQTPSILHLATHGFFLPDKEVKPVSNSTNSPQTVNIENPLLRSGLALAGFNDRRNKQDNSIEDGVLTALEVAGLHLRGTQLAILSACETGLGNVKTGDGVYGLRRALVIAGTQSQLLSLWQVDDKGTKDLMVKYYEKIKTGKGRHAALRETQLEFLNNPNYQHPFYWASFIPSGNWHPMR